MDELEKMLAKARAIQQQMESSQSSLDQVKATGASKDGRLKLTLKGSGELLEVTAAEDLFPVTDFEGLRALLLEAHADARKKLDNAFVNNLHSHSTSSKL